MVQGVSEEVWFPLTAEEAALLRTWVDLPLFEVVLGFVPSEGERVGKGESTAGMRTRVELRGLLMSRELGAG